MALGQQARFAALGADDPQLLLRALGEPGWIRHRMVLALSVTAADVNDLCGVWCPLWGRYLLAVVLGIARDLAGDVAVAIRGGFGYPQIAPAADVRHPGQTPLGRRGAQSGSERSAERLFDGESICLCDSRGRAEYKGCGYRERCEPPCANCGSH